MEQFLIDTNVISDYFSETLPEKGLIFMDSVIDSVPILSVITVIELLCWKTKTEIESKVKEFVSDSIALDLSKDVVAICVEIRRNMSIKIPDAIIAATAIGHNLTLITNNIKDFKSINRLRILNPFNL